MEENTSIENWRDNISETAATTLKIQDGEVKFVTFLDEGNKRTHADYGDSIVFQVKEDDNAEEILLFYVNPQNFALLRQIKELGSLTGKRVKISRTGSKKNDTRYSVEEQERT